MSLWAVFLTGLFAGGASCAAVQGGLLAGVVARRGAVVPGATPQHFADAVPVLGFLSGKLLSHVALGVALGAVGSGVQLSFEARSTLQITAGLVMLGLAADLLGVRAVRRLVPRPPAAWGRLVRRSGRVGGALGPAVLGSATVLIPCGATLSMEFLAVASGSPLSGAAVMAAFVLGTSPLFAALGFVARRTALTWRGWLGRLAAVAVAVAALLSIDSGLTLRGSSVTMSSAWRSLTGGGDGASGMTVPLAEDGSQRILVTARADGYSPAHRGACGAVHHDRLPQ